MFFNSDTLYISSIYLDLFVHGTGIEGWHLNSAPNFFPDMLIYMGLMWVLKKTALTSFVFSILQFASLMLLTQKLIKTLDPDTRIETLILVNATFLLLILSGIFGEDVTFPFQLLISGYHCGFFINVLLGMIAGFQYIRNGKAGALILTGVVVLIATISDKLFLVGFVAPVFIISILSMMKRDSRKRYVFLFIVVLISSFLGLLMFRWLDESSVVHFFGTGGKMFAFDNMAASFHNLIRHMTSIIANYPLQRWLIIFSLLFSIAAPVYLLSHLTSFFKDRLLAEKRNQYILVLFAFIFTISVFFTPAVNGYYLGTAHLRYNFPALILGSAGFIYLLVKHLEGFRLYTPIARYLVMVITGVFLVAIVCTGIQKDIMQGINAYVNHYPDKSRILDNLKDTNDLKYGIANYWHAKHSTTFSKNNVRVYAVHDVDLHPYYHVINENWYHDGGKGVYANPVFNFVYAEAGYDSEGRLGALFGENMDTIYSENGIIVIKLPDFKFDRHTRKIVQLNPEAED